MNILSSKVAFLAHKPNVFDTVEIQVKTLILISSGLNEGDWIALEDLVCLLKRPFNLSIISC